MTPARPHRRGAFTLVEMIVVCLLISVLGVIVTRALSSMASATAGLEKRAVNQVAARNLFDYVNQSLAAATSLGTCGVGNSRRAAPVSQCGEIITQPFTLYYATPTDLWFFANADNQLGSGSAYAGSSTGSGSGGSGSATCGTGSDPANQCGLAPADLVRIGLVADTGELSITHCRPGPSVTYTNPAWAAPTDSALGSVPAWSCTGAGFQSFGQGVGNVSQATAVGGGTTPVFEYFDSSGNQLVPATATTDPVASTRSNPSGRTVTLDAAQMAKVATVEVSAAFNTVVTGYHDSFTLTDTIALPGASGGATGD